MNSSTVRYGQKLPVDQPPPLFLLWFTRQNKYKQQKTKRIKHKQKAKHACLNCVARLSIPASNTVGGVAETRIVLQSETNVRTYGKTAVFSDKGKTICLCPLSSDGIKIFFRTTRLSCLQFDMNHSLGVLYQICSKRCLGSKIFQRLGVLGFENILKIFFYRFHEAQVLEILYVTLPINSKFIKTVANVPKWARPSGFGFQP